MGHTEGNWEGQERCPKCKYSGLFYFEEYDGEVGCTCSNCETNFMIIYEKKMVECWKIKTVRIVKMDLKLIMT